MANGSLAVARPRLPHPRRLAALLRTPSEILPRLWLSGLYTAVNEEQLIALGITHVVSVLEQRPLYPKSLPKLKTLHVPLQDVDDADILQYLDKTTDFIKRALEDKRNTVLVSLSRLTPPARPSGPARSHSCAPILVAASGF